MDPRDPLLQPQRRLTHDYMRKVFDEIEKTPEYAKQREELKEPTWVRDESTGEMRPVEPDRWKTFPLDPFTERLFKGQFQRRNESSLSPMQLGTSAVAGPGAAFAAGPTPFPNGDLLEALKVQPVVEAPPLSSGQQLSFLGNPDSSPPQVREGLDTASLLGYQDPYYRRRGGAVIEYGDRATMTDQERNALSSRLLMDEAENTAARMMGLGIVGNEPYNLLRNKAAAELASKLFAEQSQSAANAEQMRGMMDRENLQQRGMNQRQQAGDAAAAERAKIQATGGLLHQTVGPMLGTFLQQPGMTPGAAFSRMTQTVSPLVEAIIGRSDGGTPGGTMPLGLAPLATSNVAAEEDAAALYDSMRKTFGRIDPATGKYTPRTEVPEEDFNKLMDSMSPKLKDGRLPDPVAKELLMQMNSGEIDRQAVLPRAAQEYVRDLLRSQNGNVPSNILPLGDGRTIQMMRPETQLGDIAGIPTDLGARVDNLLSEGSLSAGGRSAASIPYTRMRLPGVVETVPFDRRTVWNSSLNPFSPSNATLSDTAKKRLNARRELVKLLLGPQQPQPQ